MKKAVLLYGRFPEKINGTPIIDIPECDPNNEKNWMGWTKKELELRGWDVTCPVIKEVWLASYDAWEDELDRAMIDDDTTVVALSQGAGAIIKYIIKKKKTINKLILVAPARRASIDTPEFTEFYDFDIGNGVKKQIINGTTIFVSKDDWPGILDAVKVYEDELDAKVTYLDGQGHFSFLIRTFPELLDEILKKINI